MKNASHTPRRLKINLSDLDDAFDTGGQEAKFYLDLDTGRVILLTNDARQAHRQVSKLMGEVEPADRTAAFEAALQVADVPDWEVDLVRDAELVKVSSRRRMRQVPEADSREGYRDMEAFIDSVANPRLAERLARAIGGRGAFRAFKDALLDHPAERERWFAFRDARERQRVLEWLEAEGIEPE